MIFGVPLLVLTMPSNAFLSSLTALVLCLSLFLVHRVCVFERDLHKLHGDVTPELNQQLSQGVDGRAAKTWRTREDTKPSVFLRGRSSAKVSSRRARREQSSCGAPVSFLQLKANANKQPEKRGNVTVIPWTVSAQRGNAISTRENRLVVQEDGYYLVFGQVLFQSPSEVMGHVIQSWSSTAEAGRRSTELLRCLQEMPEKDPDNTCYAAGTVYLLQDDEVELVIPHRLSPLISMEPDATFFGIIQLN